MANQRGSADNANRYEVGHTGVPHTARRCCRALQSAAVVDVV
jgi:hypothetical protein